MRENATQIDFPNKKVFFNDQAAPIDDICLEIRLHFNASCSDIILLFSLANVQLTFNVDIHHSVTVSAYRLTDCWTSIAPTWCIAVNFACMLPVRLFTNRYRIKCVTVVNMTSIF
jgi:hypothetical protein